MKQKKPVVGVTPLWDEEKESIWMLPGYMDGIMQAGGIPVILPFSDDEQELEQLVSMCDGILLTGGPDVTPGLYDEEPLGEMVVTCPKRDVTEGLVFAKAIDMDKPVLGICRGIQLINVCLGGTLYQDLPMQHPSEIVHRQPAPYDRPVHEVTLLKDSPLYDCLKMEKLSVNSSHHQAVKTLAPGLVPMAYSPDGLAEAVYMPGKRFLWAVQWHPERLFVNDACSRKIFQAFTDAARHTR